MSTTASTAIETLRARVGALLASRLPEHVSRLRWNADRLAVHQRERLRRLIDHAVRYSPFHARRLGGIDAARFDLADLTNLPTMSKG